MADLVLLGKRHLCQGLRRTVRHEQRVVAESARSARRFRDPSTQDPGAHERLPVGKPQRGDRDEPRLSIDRVGEPLEEKGVVPRDVDRLARVPGRPHAGFPAEGGDFQPGVLRQNRKPGLAADGGGLEERVLEEARTGLFDVGERAVGVRAPADAREAGENAEGLGDFPGVLRAQEDLRHRCEGL